MVGTIICEFIIITCNIDTIKYDILPIKNTIPTKKCKYYRITLTFNPL